MDDRFDLVSVGDASLDVFLTPTESETLCQLDDKDELICFSYGDKIPVKDISFSIGGNAANNSVGTKRLGINSCVILTVGEDEIGDQIIEKIIKEGVYAGFIFRNENTQSNYSTAVTFAGERTLFTYKSKVKYQIPDEFPETSWIYLTSMSKDFKDSYQKVVDHVKQKGDVKLAFNPGSRQIRAGLESIKNVMEVSYIVYVNREEAQILTGMNDTQGKEKDLLNALSALGPKIPIVTDGVNGSFVLDNGRFIRAGVMPVDSYERTGAGDAFGSGCIAALIKGKPFEEALLWGTVNSASVIGFAGAQKGLLREDEMQTWLDRAKSSSVEVKEF